MKFRLKKAEDGIVLELFLKAVKADEDYQQIRFMIKDGLIDVNGEKEYARRRLLFIGDEVTFKDKYYIICTYKDEFDSHPDEDNSSQHEDKHHPHKAYIPSEKPPVEDFIFHHHKFLHWNQKYDKDKPKKNKD